MSNVAIDTLEYTQLLRDAGVESQQAEAMAQALGKALTVNLATKDDLALAVSELNAKIDALDTKLNGRIDALDGRIDALEVKMDGKIETLRADIKEEMSNMLRWIIGIMITTQIAFAGLIITAVKLLSS